MPRTTLASLLDDAPADPAPQNRVVPDGVDNQPAVPYEHHRESPHAQTEPLIVSVQSIGQGQDGGDGHSSGPQPSATPATAIASFTTPPRYLQLERKELRIRLDQADDLARLTRRLNRARGRTGERITDNTLIRVAIDLLLTRSDLLAGATELELRASVTL